MIAVDTSVWIEYYRGKNSDVVEHLNFLLESYLVFMPNIVLYEILTGVSAERQKNLKTLLSSLPLAIPTEETWKTIETWILQASKKGLRFSLTDMLIAALAFEYQSKIWTLDKAFNSMKKMKWINLYKLP